MTAPPIGPPDLVAHTAAADEANSRLRFRATGSRADGIRVEKWPVETAATPPLDGSLDPVEFALAALISSQIATYRYRADALGVPLDDVRVDVEGELDVRGFFGLVDGIRPGLDEVRIAVRPRGSASTEDYVRLLADVDARCPVLDLFRAPPTVTTRLVTG